MPALFMFARRIRSRVLAADSRSRDAAMDRYLLAACDFAFGFLGPRYLCTFFDSINLALAPPDDDDDFNKRLINVAKQSTYMTPALLNTAIMGASTLYYFKAADQP